MKRIAGPGEARFNSSLFGMVVAVVEPEAVPEALASEASKIFFRNLAIFSEISSVLAASVRLTRRNAVRICASTLS